MAKLPGRRGRAWRRRRQSASCHGLCVELIIIIIIIIIILLAPLLTQ
jgi:hypothetical protein